MRRLLVAPLLWLAAACSGSGAGGGDGGSDGGAGGGDDAPASQAASGTGVDVGSSSSAGGGSSIGPAFCPAADPSVTEGFDVDQRLADVTVKDCSGNAVSLDAFCGAEALWIFAAHGWCPLCQSVSGKQEAIVADYADQGLVAINVVVADGQSDPPDEGYCALWRETHGHVEVYTLYDPTGAILALWPGGSSSLSAFVDRDRIIRSKLVHQSSEATIRENIEAALGLTGS